MVHIRTQKGVRSIFMEWLMDKSMSLALALVSREPKKPLGKDQNLIYSACHGNLQEVRELLQAGANVNAQSANGSTALYIASQFDYLEVVRLLLQNNKVDVNLQCTDGETALHAASRNGHLDVVRLLLQNNNVDVNLQMTDGSTPLYMASEKGHLEVVHELLQNSKVDVNIKNKNGDTALDVALKKKKEYVARHLEEHMERKKLRKENELNTHKNPEAKTPVSEEKRPSSTDVALEKDQKLLLYVMNTSSADPVELSLEYITRCIKKDSDGKPIKLGSGAFGDVFLAEDSRLPKMFAVKVICPTHRDEAAINEIRKSFQKELLTLKTFRHPDIIVLYGYSLNANSTQCLVYEHAANGSLAGFFTDDGNRARLSAGTRLSIMFKLVRAVHFLHTGGCKVAGKGWNVFHRDIKSANICLAEDFTPRLIDCGLAKFVPDDNSRDTPRLQSTTGGFAFGTPGYMCPLYVKMKGKGHPCPYIAAYDVYSIGVVLMELILGCLNGGQSTRNDSQFHDVYDIYVQDERSYQRIVDGCEKLKSDADPTIIWNPDALDLACKAAIQCMAPFPEERLSTKELLDTLRDAILLNTKVGLQHRAATSAVDSGPYCLSCNEYRTDIKCSEGHALCTGCIVVKLGDDNRCDVLCLIKECSSKLPVERLYGRIPQEAYDRFLAKGEDQTKWDECFRRLDDLRSDVYVVKVGVEHTNELFQNHQEQLHRSLRALARLSANQFKECPNLVLMTPLVIDKKDLSTPKKWIQKKFLQKYSVVFICAHSGVPGHEPFEIEVPRGWIAKVAPWLKVCLWVIKKIVDAHGVPLPISPIPILDQCEIMAGFLDSVIDESAGAVLDNFQAFLEKDDTTPIEACGKMQELTGDGYKLIAEKAQKEKRRHLWMPPKMVPVVDQNGTPIWVTGDCAKKHYGVS